MMMVSITIKGDGENKRYVVRYNAGMDTDTGKRINVQKVFETLEDAEKFKNSVKSELNKEISHQTDNENESLSFREIVEGWFYGEFKKVAKPRTFTTYQHYIDNEIVPFFGDKVISELTSNDMNTFKHHLAEKRYSKETIKGISKVLTVVFRMALKKGMVGESQMDGINLLKETKDQKHRIWSKEEIACFLNTAEKDKNGLMYHFALFTGTRLLELLALRWSDINLEEKTLTISKQLDTGSDEEAQSTSIRSGSHTVPLPSQLLTKLKLHQEQQEARKRERGDTYENGMNLIFPHGNGGFQNPKTVKVKLNRLIKEADVTPIRFGGFRKTYANLLYQSGMNALMIQRLLRYNSLDAPFHMLDSSVDAKRRSLWNDR
jgi:integrase